MTANKYEIGQVSWNNENNDTPVVLLDKNMRTALNIDVNNIIEVKHGANKTFVLVQVQFKEFIGSNKCSLNTKAGSLLDANVGDKVELVKEVSLNDKEQFFQKYLNPIGQMRAMFGMGTEEAE